MSGVVMWRCPTHGLIDGGFVGGRMSRLPCDPRKLYCLKCADCSQEVEEVELVSRTSLDAAVFALQQIELHLEDADDREPLDGRENNQLANLRGVISRVRLLAVSTLVTLGVLGELEIGPDGKPLPVELPGLDIREATDTLRALTAERESVRPDS
jgi:hypothetical protein